MAYFSSLGQSLRNYLTPKKASLHERTLTPPTMPALLGDILDQRSVTPEPRVKIWLANTASEDTLTVECTEQEVRGNKRRMLTPASTKATKKRKVNDAAYEDYEDGETDVESDLDGTTLFPETTARRTRRDSSVKHDADRKAMPPPRNVFDDRNYTPNRSLIDKKLDHQIVRKEVDLDDELDEVSHELETKEFKIRKSERRQVTDNWDGESARRHAEARKLPAEAGQWPQADKELFENLAMRGFRPLVPSNWKMDFLTLPLSLFHENNTDEPLVQCLADREFGAIHYLSNLFSLGNHVRDRRLVDLRSEHIIRRAIEDYLNWSLRDARLHNRAHAIPVFAVTHQKGSWRSVAYVIDKMKYKLHRLSASYRRVYSVQPSNEPLVDDAGSEVLLNSDDAAKFPVLTGFIITGTIVAIMTLDTNPAVFPYIEDSKPRFIASFDFSEDGMDVWNAFAVAITVMRVRKTMLQLVTKAKRDCDPLWKEVISESNGKKIDLDA